MSSPIQEYELSRRYESARRAKRRAIFWCSVIVVFTAGVIALFEGYVP